MQTIAVGDLLFEVRRSSNRRSMEITIDRGGELILSAPPSCDEKRLAAFAREKRFWVYTKLAEKEVLRAEAPARKKYVNGEGFPYLGRSHRLLLVAGQAAALKLERGRFQMEATAASAGGTHMLRWYTTRSHAWISDRVERWRSRVDVTPGEIVVQDLGFRWGSCGRNGRLNFHWRTILLPPKIVEYVVVHEMVHLHEPHHTPAFWARVEAAVTDYADRRDWLARHGFGLAGVQL